MKNATDFKIFIIPPQQYVKKQASFMSGILSRDYIKNTY